MRFRFFRKASQTELDGITPLESDEYWLQGGPATKLTPRVKESAKKIPGEGMDAVKNVHKWIKRNFTSLGGKEGNDELRRRDIHISDWERTADRILTDEIDGEHFTRHCNDFATLYIALLRAKGVPTRFVRTMTESAYNMLNTGEKMEVNDYTGHVFTEVKIGGDWILVDQGRRYHSEGGPNVDLEHNWCREVKVGERINEPESKQGPYIIIEIGHDSHEMGVHNLTEFMKKFDTFVRDNPNL
ncbi:MAG: transglutaminase-like domain-containing protein [Candidatus Altiarchaeota archaeon]